VGTTEFAAEIYEIGRDYGLRALKVRNREIRKGLETGKHMIDLAQYLKKGDVPAAFWYGLNAGLRVMLEMDDPNILIGIGDATRTFDRLIVLDDTYFNYAPHLFRGPTPSLRAPCSAVAQKRLRMSSLLPSKNRKQIFAGPCFLCTVLRYRGVR